MVADRVLCWMFSLRWRWDLRLGIIIKLILSLTFTLYPLQFILFVLLDSSLPYSQQAGVVVLAGGSGGRLLIRRQQPRRWRGSDCCHGEGGSVELAAAAAVAAAGGVNGGCRLLMGTKEKGVVW
uniref:Uncharacterized protein n=1 Tax=Tanacetum cinerariifolium TaxID=118510 RepID=A0A699KXH0_TANCI|nr:hypothetical protein [Tanacetum cinerariifolium]